jgi:DNA modification methylase
VNNALALILKYTNPGDTVLGVMSGSGTTCMEALLLGRNCIAVDINYNAVMPTNHRLYYLIKALRERRQKKLIDYTGREGRNNVEAWYRVFHEDARSLDKIPDNSVDLVATHPHTSIYRVWRGES